MAGVVFCDMCDENSGSVVQNMGFEVVDFGVHEKRVGKRQFCITKCENLRKFCTKSCFVSILYNFLVASPSLLGEAAKLLKQFLMPFCVAFVARRDIPTCLLSKVVVLCAGAILFASFSEAELHFSWQAQHFGDLHCHFAWQAQHRRVVLRVFGESHCQNGVKW